MADLAMPAGRRLIAVGIIRRGTRRTTRLTATPTGVTGSIRTTVDRAPDSPLHSATAAACAADYASPAALRLRGGAA